MKGIIRRLRPSPAMVVACIALMFAMTGAGYAAGTLGPNTVGTKQLKKNAVISSKVKNRSLLAVDFKAGQLPKGAKGDPGAPGAPGAPGQQGPAGPGAQWATVNSAGNIVRQSGGITSAKVQTGGYVVTFPEEVTRHLILVTPALASDLTTRGAAIAAPCVDFVASCGSATVANSVSVFTLSTTGSQQDHSFTVSEMGPNSTAAAVPQHGAARSERLDSLR
jgi:hypothetical protein